MSLIRREKPPKITDKMEPVNTAAQRLGCSRDTIIRYVGQGNLRGAMSKPLMINSADVTELIRKRCKEAGIEI